MKKAFILNYRRLFVASHWQALKAWKMLSEGEKLEIINH